MRRKEREVKQKQLEIEQEKEMFEKTQQDCLHSLREEKESV